MNHDAGGRSHKGQRRERNEDSLGIFKTSFGDVFLIADGMGGHKGGALASKTVRDEITKHLRGCDSAMRLNDALQFSATETNHTVLKLSRSATADLAGLGSTLVLAVVQGDHLTVGHAGDSRAYLLHDGQLQRLTRDHSAVEGLLHAGVLTEEEARVHPAANRITRAFGQEDELALDISDPISVASGDQLILCSDGLSGTVPEASIAETLAQGLLAKDTCEALIAKANANGGPDNITVIVVKFHDGAISAQVPELPPTRNEALLETEVQQTPRQWKWPILTVTLAFICLVLGVMLFRAGTINHQIEKEIARLRTESAAKQVTHPPVPETIPKASPSAVTPQPGRHEPDKGKPEITNLKTPPLTAATAGGVDAIFLQGLDVSAQRFAPWDRPNRAILQFGKGPAVSAYANTLKMKLGALRLVVAAASPNDIAKLMPQLKPAGGRLPDVVIYLPAPNVGVSGELKSESMKGWKQVETLDEPRRLIIRLRGGTDVVNAASQLRSDLNQESSYEILDASDPNAARLADKYKELDILIHTPPEPVVKGEQ